MRNTSLAHHIVPGFVLYIKRHSSSSDRKRIASASRRPRRLSPNPQVDYCICSLKTKEDGRLI